MYLTVNLDLVQFLHMMKHVLPATWRASKSESFALVFTKHNILHHGKSINSLNIASYGHQVVELFPFQR